MRKFIHIVFVFIIIITQSAYAEKPFIDSNGKVTLKYIKLKQINRIKKINNKLNIKILDIITYPYYDISDDLFCYGVWNKRDSVAVPVIFIKNYLEDLSNFYDESDSTFYYYIMNRKFADVIKKLDSLRIYIDLEGKTYINYKEISNQQIYELIDNISVFNKNSGDTLNPKSITVFTAPLLDETIGRLIKMKLLLIKNYAKKKDVDCWDKITEDIFK
ncbi:MAG: hypothetical protein HZB41_06620 [Ignavibacteriae bacterium]|nr:hypothetical protein [Ignavibacteriota bacterium]